MKQTHNAHTTERTEVVMNDLQGRLLNACKVSRSFIEGIDGATNREDDLKFVILRQLDDVIKEAGLQRVHAS